MEECEMNIAMLNGMIEELSEQVHNAWWEEKKRQGFHAPAECLFCLEQIRTEPDKKRKKHCNHCHTDMYPYNELPENIKEYDRVTVRSVLAAIKKIQAEQSNASQYKNIRVTSVIHDIDLSGVTNQALLESDALRQRVDEYKAVLKQAKETLETLHPMNPDEPCSVYEIWEKINNLLP
jgi:hypothetical protein